MKDLDPARLELGDVSATGLLTAFCHAQWTVRYRLDPASAPEKGS